MYLEKGKHIRAAMIMLILFAAAVIGIMLLRDTDAEAAELSAGKKGIAYNYTIGKGSDGKYYVYKPGTVKFAANDIKVGGTVYTGYCVNFYEETWSGWPYKAKNKGASAKLSSNGKKWLPYVLMYGYHKGKASPVKGTNSNDYRAATEVMVWDFNEGWRTSASGKLKKDRAYKSIAGRPAAKIYRSMLRSIASHISGPSFAKGKKKDAPTYKMKYSYSTGKYSAEIRDTRKANHFKAVSKDGVSISRNGYTYRFFVKKKGSSLVKWANDIKAGTSQPFLVWQSTSSVSARQGVATGATDDTVFYTRFTTEKDGSLKLIKKSENGEVKGFRIKVEAAPGNNNGYRKIFTTDKDGVLTTNIAPGKYRVTESLTAAQKSAGWKVRGKNPQTVTVKEGETTSVTLTNYKEPQTQDTGVKIIKTTNNDIADLSGFRFRVREIAGSETAQESAEEDGRARSDTGEKNAAQDGISDDVSETVMDKIFETDKDGLITEKLAPGKYEVTEVMTDEQKKRYRDPAKAVFTLTEKEPMAEIRMENIEKRISLRIVKTSDDGVIEGVEFIIKGTTAWGEEIEPVTLITDEKGEASYDGLPAGSYTATEILEEGTYVPQEPRDFAADDDNVTLKFHNRIDRPVEVSKESATTGKELPGASMMVRDAETGKTVEKWISTDEPHILTNLEYGKKYILHEDLAPIGYLTACDIHFTAGYDEKVTMIDEVTRTVVIKKDADTGKMLEGAVIHIIDPETNKTVGKVTTEKKQGSVIEMLEAEKTYIAREVKAPEGYQLAKDVEFKAGADVEVVVKDKKKSVPETPATGDETGGRLRLLVVAMMISLLWILIIFRRHIRKKP